MEIFLVFMIGQTDRIKMQSLMTGETGNYLNLANILNTMMFGLIYWLTHYCRFGENRFLLY